MARGGRGRGLKEICLFPKKILAFHILAAILRGVAEILWRYRGRPIGPEEITFLRQLIAAHPQLSRRRLSVLVCQAWHWMQPNGVPRDMVCRGLLLALHRAGHIELPAQRCHPLNNAITHRRVAAVEPVDVTPIQGELAGLGALEIRLVRRTEEEGLFGYLLSEYHYLGYSRPVGEHLKYLVLAGPRPVACLGWSSAPRQLGLRDEFIGGSPEQSRRNLRLIAYNTRFLIVPWARIPHLASQVLGRIARRISADWQKSYGHPVCLLESFVDTERFGGACYRAANWLCVGQSQGRGTKAPTRRRTCSIKQLWVYPLSPHFRQHLLGATDHG